MRRNFIKLFTRILCFAGINTRYGKIDKMVSGHVCFVPSKANKLGDLTVLNHTTQHFDIDYLVTYGLSESFYEENQVFFENHCFATNFLIFNEKAWQLFSSIRKIRAQKIDAVILDREPVIPPVFFFLAGVPVIITSAFEPDFSTDRYDIGRFDLHFSERYKILLELLGNKNIPEIKQPYFPFTGKKMLPFDSVHDEISMVMHIGGGAHMMRRWPVVHYIELCKKFLDKYRGRILLIGGGEEHGENEKLKALLEKKYKGGGRVLNYSGVDLNSFCSILHEADIFVGNDSGPMNVANALHLPVLAIFGPSAKAVFNPTDYREENVTVSLDLECMPCNALKCKLRGDEVYRCLTELPVSTVWNSLRIMLDKILQNKKTENRKPVFQN